MVCALGRPVQTWIWVGSPLSRGVLCRTSGVGKWSYGLHYSNGSAGGIEQRLAQLKPFSASNELSCLWTNRSPDDFISFLAPLTPAAENEFHPHSVRILLLPVGILTILSHTYYLLKYVDSPKLIGTLYILERFIMFKKFSFLYESLAVYFLISSIFSYLGVKDQNKLNLACRFEFFGHWSFSILQRCQKVH